MGRATRRLRQLKGHIIHGHCVAPRLGHCAHDRVDDPIASDCQECEADDIDGKPWTLLRQSRRGRRWWKKRCKRQERDMWDELRPRDAGIAASYMADREIPF